MKYSKSELIEAYKNTEIVRTDKMNKSLLVSDQQVIPVNVDRFIPIEGNINSHLKKRTLNNNKKSKVNNSPASKIDWDNQSGWASRFKKSDDLFNKVSYEYCSDSLTPFKKPLSRPGTPSNNTSPKGLNNRPPKKSDKALSNVIGSLGLDRDDDIAPPPPPPLVDWVYRDPSGSLQGPFNADTMQQWFLAGYFPSTLLVRRVDSEAFIPLEDLLVRVQDRSQPFHSITLPSQPPALSVNTVNQRFNQSPVIRNSSPVVDLNGLYHPQPQPQLQRLATTDSTASSPVSTPFGRPLWASNSPALDIAEQQQSREEFLMALRHREVLEHQQQQQQQFIQQQLVQHQQQAQQQQQELHAWQLQQHAQQEAQKQAQEQAQEQLANTHLRDDADISVAVEAPESTVDSVTEDGIMSPIKTPENPPSVVQPVQPMHSVQQPQNSIRGGVNVVTQTELERLQRGATIGKPNNSQHSPKMSVSLTDVMDKQTSEQGLQPPKKAVPAPWAPQPQPESVKEKPAPSAPSLKEIQEAEARQSELNKQAQAAQRAAIQQQQPTARADDIVPGTLKWGLAGNVAVQPPPPATQPGAPAWGGSNLNQKKSLRQIQEEEEMKEREVQKRKMITAQANAAARGYAASAQRTAQLNGGGAVAGSGGAWTVVQGGGAKPAPAPAPAAKPAPAPAPAPVKPAPAPKPAAPAVSVPPSIAQGTNVREPGAPSEDFTKWCKASLTGLNGTTGEYRHTHKTHH